MTEDFDIPETPREIREGILEAKWEGEQDDKKMLQEYIKNHPDSAEAIYEKREQERLNTLDMLEEMKSNRGGDAYINKSHFFDDPILIGRNVE